MTATKITHYEKERLRYLAANVLLYVRRDGNFVFRPSGMRFHRDGTVSGYHPGEGGWTRLDGMTADGPRSGDSWTFPSP
jgi:hypothetical protein